MNNFDNGNVDLKESLEHFQISVTDDRKALLYDKVLHTIDNEPYRDKKIRVYRWIISTVLLSVALIGIYIYLMEDVVNDYQFVDLLQSSGQKNIDQSVVVDSESSETEDDVMSKLIEGHGDVVNELNLEMNIMLPKALTISQINTIRKEQLPSGNVAAHIMYSNGLTFVQEKFSTVTKEDVLKHVIPSFTYDEIEHLMISNNDAIILYEGEAVDVYIVTEEYGFLLTNRQFQDKLSVEDLIEIGESIFGK